MTTERFNLVCLHYPEYIQMSKARKAKYFKHTDKLPKNLQKRLEAKEVEYRVNGKENNLFDIQAGTFIIKNKKVAGTPNVKPINGQVLWSSGLGSQWERQKLKDFLKLYFIPLIARNLPEKIYTSPGQYIQLEYIFYFPFRLRSGVYQDYINHFYIRGKVFEDCLVEMGIIQDDNPDILRGGYARYVEIDSEMDRRLEIKIHFCKNNERIC